KSDTFSTIKRRSGGSSRERRRCLPQGYLTPFGNPTDSRRIRSRSGATPSTDRERSRRSTRRYRAAGAFRTRGRMEQPARTERRRHGSGTRPATTSYGRGHTRNTSPSGPVIRSCGRNSRRSSSRRFRSNGRTMISRRSQRRSTSSLKRWGGLIMSEERQERIRELMQEFGVDEDVAARLAMIEADEWEPDVIELDEDGNERNNGQER